MPSSHSISEAGAPREASAAVAVTVTPETAPAGVAADPAPAAVTPETASVTVTVTWPVTVTVRFFAAARAAAGQEEERLAVPAPPTLGQAVRVLANRHGERLERVLARCSFLVNGTAARRDDTVLHDDDQLDVLPPFAGG